MVVADEVKRITSRPWVRHVISVSALLTSLYACSGPIIAPMVKAYAADSLIEVLKDNGMDPSAIAEMKQQGITNGVDIKNVNSDIQKVQNDVNMINNNINKLIQSQAVAAQQNMDTKEIVEKLLRLQLQDRGTGQ